MQILFLGCNPFVRVLIFDIQLITFPRSARDVVLPEIDSMLGHYPAPFHLSALRS